MSQKKCYRLSKCFRFFEIHNSHIFPAVSPQRGLTSNLSSSSLILETVVLSGPHLSSLDRMLSVPSYVGAFCLLNIPRRGLVVLMPFIRIPPATCTKEKKGCFPLTFDFFVYLRKSPIKVPFLTDLWCDVTRQLRLSKKQKVCSWCDVTWVSLPEVLCEILRHQQ